MTAQQNTYNSMMSYYRQHASGIEGVDCQQLARNMEEYLSHWCGGSDYHASRLEMEEAYATLRIEFPQ